MKRILILLLSCSLCSQAQVLRNVRVEKLSGSQPGDCRVAGISPDGSYVLTTTQTSKGLRQIDLKTGRQIQLTDIPGAGFQPSISENGRKILCRKVTFDERHMRQTSLEMLDLDSGTHRQLRAPSREVRAYRADDVASPARAARAEVFIEDLQLMVTVDGVTPNISPDGQLILYYVSGEGAYVCDLEGRNVRFIAHDCRAPQWYDDETIIGMNDRDDGEMLLSSSIMAYSLNGEAQELTDPSQMLMYPQCCARRGVIACSGASGEVFLINVER